MRDATGALMVPKMLTGMEAIAAREKIPCDESNIVVTSEEAAVLLEKLGYKVIRDFEVSE